MKKILGFLSLLFIVFVAQAQTPVTRSQTVQATQDLLPPLDTVLAPIRSGEIRFKPSDSTFYGSTSTTSPKMWWPLSTSYTLPFGSSTLTNLSIDANGRIVSATQGVLPYAPLPINIFANGNGQVANGAEGDYVYIKGNGVPDTLKHFYNKVTARDTLWVRYSLDGGYTWSTAVKATLHLWFPQVEFYPATGLYYATGTTSAEKNVWLYNSSDGINWSALNSGNPVLSASTDTTNYAYSLFNTGFVIIRTNGVDIIHYLCEGSAKQAQTGVTAGGGWYANGPYSGYVNAPLSSPAAILPLKPQLKGGNTKLFYIPEHNAILTMYGYYTGIFPDYSQNWVIRFAKTSLNNNLQDSSSWIPIKKQWNLGNTADPSIGFLGNNDSAIVYYEYNQGSSGNQAYMPHIRTPLQLYEGMVDSAYQFNVLNNTAQRVTTATGLGDRINAEANLTFDGTTLTTPYGRIKNNLYFGNSSTTEYISPDGLGSLYTVANNQLYFYPGGIGKGIWSTNGLTLGNTTLAPAGATLFVPTGSAVIGSGTTSLGGDLQVNDATTNTSTNQQVATFLAPNSSYVASSIGTSSTRNGTVLWNDPGGAGLFFQTYSNSFPITFQGSNVIFGPGGSEKTRIAGAGQLLVGTTSPIGAEKARVFGKLAVDTLATGVSGTDSIVVWNSVSKDFRKIAPGSGGGTTTYFINSKLGDTTFRTTGPGLAANTIQWKGLIPGNGMNSVTTDSTIKYNWGGTLAQATTINNNGFNVTFSGTGNTIVSGGGQLLAGTTAPIALERVRVFGKLAVDTLAAGTSGVDSQVVWNVTNKDFRKVAPYSTPTLQQTISAGNALTQNNSVLLGTYTLKFTTSGPGWFTPIATPSGRHNYTFNLNVPDSSLGISWQQPAGFTKGSAIVIDTNNNVFSGAIYPAGGVTGLPQWSTGNNVGIAYLQVTQAMFSHIRTVSATTTLTIGGTNGDRTILVDATAGSIVITLPAASASYGSNTGLELVFRRIDASANTVTIQRAGTDTIDGATNFTMSSAQVKRIQAASASAWYSL